MVMPNNNLCADDISVWDERRRNERSSAAAVIINICYDIMGAAKKAHGLLIFIWKMRV